MLFEEVFSHTTQDNKVDGQNLPKLVIDLIEKDSQFLSPCFPCNKEALKEAIKTNFYNACYWGVTGEQYRVCFDLFGVDMFEVWVDEWVQTTADVEIRMKMLYESLKMYNDAITYDTNC